MKSRIDEQGVLHVTAESRLEKYAVEKWQKDNPEVTSVEFEEDEQS